MTASWLSTKLGVDTMQIHAMRRAGELLAVRPAGSQDWVYPAWQFNGEGKLRPEVRRVLAAARERGIDTQRLTALLHRRSGMTQRGTLLDSLLAGNVDHVVAALR